MVTNLEGRFNNWEKLIQWRNQHYAGYDQLYLRATPGTFVAPWIRDLTTSKLRTNQI